MDNTIKISLTIELEGRTLVKSAPETVRYSLTERDVKPFKHWKGKDGMSIVKRGKFTHCPLIAKPASQHISINIAAYNYMTSTECPYWSKPKLWSKLTRTQRLEAHLSRICDDMKGKTFSYKILEE